MCVCVRARVFGVEEESVGDDEDDASVWSVTLFLAPMYGWYVHCVCVCVDGWMVCSQCLCVCVCMDGWCVHSVCLCMYVCSFCLFLCE